MTFKTLNFKILSQGLSIIIFSMLIVLCLCSCLEKSIVITKDIEALEEEALKLEQDMMVPRP